MSTTLRVFVAFLATAVGIAPAAADVIPVHIRTAGDESARERVDGRLQGLGIGDAETREHVARLTDDDVALFATAPSALQFAGQSGPPEGQDVFAGESYNLWYETAGGIFGLLFAFALIGIMVTNHE